MNAKDLVIIPAFNESETLPSVLADLRRVLPGIDVVVVDDGSSDDTARVAAASPGVTVLRLPFNLGIGSALRTGFRYAVAEGYQRAVQLDADGQHDPGEVPRLLEALDGADLVVGSRFGRGATTYEVGHTRRGAMRVLQLALHLLTGRRFSDTSSGFRAFDRSVLEYFAVTYPSEYMESVEVLLQATYEGFRIAEVPVRMNPRAGGRPSTLRLGLAYHYLRVLVTLFVRTSRRRPAPLAIDHDVERDAAGDDPGTGT